MSKKYVIDTNVLYGLVFNDGHCKADNALDILNENIDILTYGTLFETFDRYIDDTRAETLLVRSSYP